VYGQEAPNGYDIAVAFSLVTRHATVTRKLMQCRLVQQRRCLRRVLRFCRCLRESGRRVKGVRMNLRYVVREDELHGNKIKVI